MEVNCEAWSPNVEISFIRAKRGDVAVVRDDKLKGGTKQRAAIPWLTDICAWYGYREFIYASPPPGFAQVALAHACQAIGVDCAIYAQVDDSGVPSLATRSIMNIANVELCESLEDAEWQASIHERAVDRSFKVPLGFDDPGYRWNLRDVITEQWRVLTGKLGFSPKRLWLPVGSGTLLSTFREVLDIPIIGIDVGVLPGNDTRINKIKGMRNVIYRQAPEKFSEPSHTSAPIPANKHYDEKLYQFVMEEGEPGDVWWVVAA